MRKKTRRHPFTLAEVLVASCLLMLLAAGIYGTVSMSTWMIFCARNHLEAQSLAVDRCWIAYRKEYSDLLITTAVKTEAVPDTHVLKNLGGTIRTAVATYSDHVDLTVRVDWVENGKPANESFTVSRYDDR
ncbi:MAG: hypothetical protein WC708_15920 [Lentisphaeria bacterium]